jgi:Herpesviridae UL52/UL70 DNA primase
MSLSPSKISRHRDDSTKKKRPTPRRRKSLGDDDHSDDSIDDDGPPSFFGRSSLPEKENNIHASESRWGPPSSKKSPRKHRSAKKSHGLPPSDFHKKTIDLSTTTDNKTVPEWKQTLEHNLLIQQHEHHTQQLEQRRKTFRMQTQLKTWPLQDMAMEHLDHLLGRKSSAAFHGGDYLSAESSTSVSSMEASRPRLNEKVATAPVTPTASGEANTRNDNHDPTDPPMTTTTTTTSPLWSLEPRIFAIEKSQGKRKYLVGQFGRIADWYWRKAVPPRHLYEVIREGTPCRMYFDLEFSKVHNPELVETEHCTMLLLQEFQQELVADLQTHYNLHLATSQIINLDSSSDTKFSRHWIIHLKEPDQSDNRNGDDDNKDGEAANVRESNTREVLFRDAPTVGRFVKRLVSRLAEERAVQGGDFADRRPMLSKYLFVNTKDDNKPTCFIDLGVYTRNRLFRCLGSSKFGKAATLQVILEEENAEGQPQQYFSLDLPPNKKLETSQSSQPLPIEDFVAANDWEPHAKALAETLVVPVQEWPRLAEEDKSKNSHPHGRILDVLDETYGGITSGKLLGTSKSDSKGANKSYRSAPTIPMVRQGSPLPSLDKFVNEVLGVRGGTQGSIRAWSVEYGHRDTPVSITYQMQRNRFCELIGRSHKSNNIFWTVDFSSWTCIQGCHDPDCHGRGSPVPIPNEYGRLDAIQKELETWQEEEFEKALMSLNIDDIVIEAKKSSNAEDNKESTAPNSSYDQLSDDALLQAISQNPELFP